MYVCVCVPISYTLSPSNSQSPNLCSLTHTLSLSRTFYPLLPLLF